MTKGLMSLNDIKKEEFNLISFRVENISQFLAYYTLILTTAYQYGFISEKDSNRISNLILSSLTDRFQFETQLLSNNLYVLTLYLKSMDNFTQVETLSKLSDVNSINDLFDKANVWISRQISILKSKLKSISPKIMELENPLLKDTFDEILSDLKELSSYSTPKTTCNLKKLHVSSIILRYPLLHSKDESFEKENYLHGLQFIVNSFEKEVCILYKLNPKSVIKNLKKSVQVDLDSTIYGNIDNVNAIQFELEDLEEEYAEKLKEAKDSLYSFDDALHKLEVADRETFKKMHPELTGYDFEVAFEDWQFSLPDEHFNVEENYIDEEEIKKEYEEKRSKIMKKFKNADKQAEEKIFETEVVELSLETILKVIAMLELYKINPNFNLPENNSELSSALEKIPVSSAIEVILKTIKPELLESELRYLKDF